jgi:hypothetical protein
MQPQTNSPFCHREFLRLHCRKVPDDLSRCRKLRFRYLLVKEPVSYYFRSCHAIFVLQKYGDQITVLQ